MPAAAGPQKLVDGNNLSSVRTHTTAIRSGVAVASDAISESSIGASDSSTTSDSDGTAAERHTDRELAVKPANVATPSMSGAHERPRPLPDFLTRGGAAVASALVQQSSTAPGGMSCGDACLASRYVLIKRC